MCSSKQNIKKSLSIYFISRFFQYVMNTNYVAIRKLYDNNYFFDVAEIKVDLLAEREYNVIFCWYFITFYK